MGEEKVKEEWPGTKDQIECFHPLYSSPSRHVFDKKLHRLATLTIWYQQLNGTGSLLQRKPELLQPASLLPEGGNEGSERGGCLCILRSPSPNRVRRD